MIVVFSNNFSVFPFLLSLKVFVDRCLMSTFLFSHSSTQSLLPARLHSLPLREMPTRNHSSINSTGNPLHCTDIMSSGPLCRQVPCLRPPHTLLSTPLAILCVAIATAAHYDKSTSGVKGRTFPAGVGPYVCKGGCVVVANIGVLLMLHATTAASAVIVVVFAPSRLCPCHHL